MRIGHNVFGADIFKSYGLNQSMSKRGNCWDNSPQESFLKKIANWKFTNFQLAIISICHKMVNLMTLPKRVS
ncbi:hypothetical protein E9840_03400 [Tissierella creatinini]|nr:hypothetical protein E9840_03400 [Tissierella creatinini]TJX63250.1 hypothetical protein E8P77_15490 [Soehngenia saccharolytica]